MNSYTEYKTEAGSDYQENHGESPSIEAEARRKALRTGKVQLLIKLMKIKDGLTAGEMWQRFQFELKEAGSTNIYDLRRTLSMCKKAVIIFSGEKRACRYFSTSDKTINTYPWFLVNV